LKQKKSKSKIEALGERYRIIFENSCIGMLFIENDTTIALANLEFEKMTGYAKSEVEGKMSLQELIADKTDIAGLKNYYSLRRSEPGFSPDSYDTKIKNKNGNMIDVLFRVSMIPETSCSLASIIDITQRKIIEENMRISEEKYRMLVDNIQGVLYRTDIKGNLSFITAAGARSLGFNSADELIGKNIAADFCYNLKDGIALLEIINKEGKIINFEVKLKRKDGITFIASMNNQRWYDKNGNFQGIEGTFTDITESGNIEEALRDSEEMLRSIVFSIPIGLHIYNLESPGRLVFTGANPAADRILGIDNSLFIGKTIEKAFPSLVGTGVPDHYRETAEKGTTWHNEQVNYDENTIKGAYDVYAFQIGPDRMVAAFTDITRRLQTEQYLQMFQFTVDQAFEAILWYTQDAGIEYANEQACRSLGYTREELMQLKLWDIDPLFPKEQWEFNWKKFHEERRGGTISTESMNKRKDGTVFPVGVMAKHLWFGDRELHVAVVRDLTEQKRMEEEHRRLEQQLFQSQKLDAIGTLAGGIAHDFNNILSGIFGFTELSLQSLDNTEQIKKYLNHVLSAAERAREMVNQILTFSRRSETDIKEITPKYIINEALKLLRASIPSTIEVRPVINSKSAILGNPTQLHQIIVNLCANAAYAMRDRKGLLEIQLEDIDVDPAFVKIHPGLQPGKYVLLRITDTGCGIKPEFMDRVFEPFFTTKPQGEGTGLGLSVVHGIVKKFNGIVTFYSEVEKGTTFNIFLPVVVSEQIGKDMEQDANFPRGSERVLLLDDEISILGFMRIILMNLGYSVISFNDSSAAYEEFKKNSNGYDLIITDYTMPQNTGIDIANKIKGLRDDIPVILCSGYVHKGMEEEASKAGICEVLRKPVRMADLAKAIRRCLDVKNPG
jgi:PAS domain S-box-containing protein